MVSIATQLIFRRHFNLGRNGAILSCNAILRWVEALRTAGNIAKKEPPGPAITARAPEYIAWGPEAINRSPSRPAYARELQKTRDSVRKILNLDLKFYLCKTLRYAHCQPIHGSCEEHISRLLISRFGDVPPWITSSVTWSNVFIFRNPILWKMSL